MFVSTNAISLANEKNHHMIRRNIEKQKNEKKKEREKNFFKILSAFRFS
jgi:hypothetical protein